MHDPVKIHLQFNKSRICFLHDNIITVLSYMISKFKIMIMISKPQSGFLYPFTDRIQLWGKQPEILNRSESRIKPWPGNIALTKSMCSFYTLINIPHHCIRGLIE